MAETQICRVQSPSPCDYTHTRAQKQKLVLSAVFKWKSSPQGMQQGWIFLDLLLVCPVESGHGIDPHCSLPKHWWEKPWDSSQSKRETEKPLRKERKAARLFCTHRRDRLWGTMGLLPILRSLWASSSSWDHGLSPGVITPLPKVTIYPSEQRNTIPPTPCRNQCDETQNSQTQTAPAEHGAVQRSECSFITKLTLKTTSSSLSTSKIIISM